MRTRPLRVLAALAALALAASLGTSASATPGNGTDSGVVVDWNRIALRTVYAEGGTPVPAGPLYLGFTSLAVHDAVTTATDRRTGDGRVSVVAAAAVAAHDVLVEYFPGSAVGLDADLARWLGSVKDGPAEDTGVAIGAAAADRMVASRVGDGRGSTSHPFTLAPAPGVWRPTTPGTSMAVPWLGFVTPLVLDSATQIQLQGPDALTSAAYAADFDETRLLGSATSTVRSAEQTQTALFFNDNVIRQLVLALADNLTEHPRSIAATSRIFAVANAAIADGLITTWRAKHDVGFWRPVTAIREADTDGNTLTVADPGWTPLVGLTGTPPYPENASGHATVTNAVTTALALLQHGDHTDLELESFVPGLVDGHRHYSSLRDLSDDAFDARIWLGIHFRAAMDDGRHVGQEAARLVAERVD
ncbi:MAG TPA: vanadium-dependent haloperoxidase [Nocardioidaceae bacterium]